MGQGLVYGMRSPLATTIGILLTGALACSAPAPPPPPSPEASTVTVSRRPILSPLAAAVLDADVIVLGRVTSSRTTASGTETHIVVDESLKGAAGSELVVHGDFATAPMADRETDAIAERSRLFFIDRYDGALYHGHPTMAGPEHHDRVRRLARMLADPEPFVRDPRHHEDPVLVTYVGHAFAVPVIRCDDDLGIGEAATTVLQMPGARSVWGVRDAWTVHVRYDGDFAGGRIVDAGHLPEIASEILYQARSRLRAASVQALDLTCRVDTRLPPTAGGLSAADALRFVRGRLRAADPTVVAGAIGALRLMHDLESIPAISTRRQHPDALVMETAMAFMADAQDRARRRGGPQ